MSRADGGFAWRRHYTGNDELNNRKRPRTVRTDRGSTAVMFSTAERAVEIATEQMLTLEYDIPHDVEGIVDSSFLLTIAWRIHPLFGSDGKMSKTFKCGDHVEWNSEAGRVRGTVVKKVVSEVKFKGYTHHATKEEPQYFIKSDKTDHVAIHKGSALRLLKLSSKKISKLR